MNRLIAIYFAIIVSACYVWLFRASTLPRVLHGYDNYGMFLFTKYSHLGVPNEEVPNAWKSRMLPLKLSGWITDVTHTSWQNEGWTFAAYNAGWLFATLLLLALAVKDVIPIIGTGLCIWLNSVPELWPYVLPWDMPCMFFFTLAFVSYRAKQWDTLFLAAVVGSLFKDSLQVALLFFFASPWKVRIRCSVIGLGLITAHIVNYEISQSASVATVNILNGLRHVNWMTLLHCSWELLANGGTLPILLICLIKSRDFALGIVCLSFVLLLTLTNIQCNIFNEYRAWQDILPLTWCLIAEQLYRKDECDK